jgi:hypothetical protein
MYQFDFEAKLKRLNPRLYIGGEVRKHNDEWAAQGLYMRRATNRTPIEASLKAQADGDTQKFLEEQEKGLTDDYVCGVPHGWVPEYPVFDPKTRRLVARGWRGIVLTLVERKITTLARARQVFGSSIGETTYDRLPFHVKQQLHLNDLKEKHAV